MIIFIKLSLMVLWYVIGAIGFVFWFTKKHDYTLAMDDICVTGLAGLGGPFTWIIAWLAYGVDSEKVIIHKRNI
jgi:hypothetical protein